MNILEALRTTAESIKLWADAKIPTKTSQLNNDSNFVTLNDVAVPNYNLVKAANSGDYAAVYNLTKDGAIVGASINIPKDMVVKSGSVVGDEIVLVLNDEEATEIKIPVSSLVEYVTSGSEAGDMVVIAIDETTHKVTATITDGTITAAKFTTELQTAIDKAHSHENAEVLAGIDADRLALLENYVTPQMFGAVGDGVADDTEAVQSALDHGGVVYFPAGVYKVTKQLTTTKPCVIKMFKPYPSQFWRSGNTSGRYDYPIRLAEGENDYETEKGWDFGARIECYPSDGEQYGFLIGDGCEVDGLFMRAMNGFSGVLLKYDNSHQYGTDNLGDPITYSSYPSSARFKHIRLDCDRHNHETTIPESMFDFFPKNKYFYILDDIVIGQGDEFATYGFRSIVDPETDRWANSVRISNLCLNGLFDYPLYVVEGCEDHSFTNWIFEGLSIQTWGYNYDDFQKAMEGHKAVVTLKGLNYCLFSGCYIWDLFAAKYVKLFDCENLNNISCVGCSEEFDYGTKKLVGDAGEEGIETVLKNKLQEAGANVKTLTMSTSVAGDGGNRVNLSDNYGNTIYTDLPPVALSDEQLSTGIGNWMDDNAAPVEQEGKNKLNIYSEDMKFGYNLNSNGNLLQAAEGAVQGRWATSHFIQANCGDVFRMSHNGIAFNWSEIAEYDKDYKFLVKYNYNDESVVNFVVAIKHPDTAYIRVNFNTFAYMTDEEKDAKITTNLEVVERGKYCVTFNNSDISYEPYGIELVGGLSSYFKLQSPNGTKYSLAATDDGVIVGKNENGEIATPNVPTKTSHLENDSGFVTVDDIPQAVDVPTKLSQLENDSGFITSDDIPAVDIPTKVSDLTNDSNYITLSDIPEWAKASSKPSYTAKEVGADAFGTAENAVSTHNTNTSAHSDLRDLISGLSTRLNALADSDDTTLDQMSEIVTYIKANKTLIDGITTGKVNVSDITNNLTTNVSNKPLSAAQGVALKSLIDAITVPTKLSQLTNDKGYITGYTETDPTVPSWAKAASKPTYTKSEVGLGNVDNVKQYSASNPPPYPVTSVNGKTGAVTVSALPAVTTADNGKVLMVVNGAWKAVDLNMSIDSNGVVSV